ncbi:Rv3654c family TadE-like protein [Actinomyces bouchesdurhonensis]|uniref:Rv3654c family TadE-like protein n=1 Tax=Actinomyces bouchesdurhonensis TaxID=1852361 RepID=UPI003C7455B2
MGRRTGTLQRHHDRRGGPAVTTTGHGFVRPPVGALPLHPDRTRPGEDGSGTVNSLGLITLALTLAFVLAGMGCAHTATVKLQAVADLAALAGAEHSASALWEDVGGRPCEAAAAVAAANGVGVESCEVLGSDCRVVVGEDVSVLGVSTTLRARARAGTSE